MTGIDAEQSSPETLAATRVTFVDCTTEQSTGSAAQNRTDGLVTAPRHFAADDSACCATDQQTGRAVIALAIIAAVVSAP